MNFPQQFISASTDYADFDHQVPAPYIRKKFTLDAAPRTAELLITGLGFYQVFINGTEITKSILAPYISNPDDVIYYDRYDTLPYLTRGDNVIGIILGNGMQNAYGGFVWDFDKARWRSAPMTALRMDMTLDNGECLTVESDTTFRTHPSPLLENELRSGDCYDARLSIEDWCSPSFSDAAWNPALKVTPPRGEMRLCQASPIKTYERRKAISIIPYEDGYLYDFGTDSAGVCELRIKGKPGQKIQISYAEWYHDGILEKKNLMFPEYDFPYTDRVQNSTYICRGDEVEAYIPSFTYYGFRYAYIKGIEKDQALPDLLTYHVMGGDFQEIGTFSCSDPTANELQAMTRNATISNFFWFPTDCPHREKNGWTGDAALSAEHMLMNLAAEDSLREWLHNVELSQAPDGSLPGIVPTAGWGFGCGPAWDQVITEVPFYLLKLRGDLQTAEEAAPFIFRYLFYLSGIRNEKGLIDTGLGDWCETGKSGGGHKAPVEVTSTATAVHLLEEAKYLFKRLNRKPEYHYADTLMTQLKKSFRKYLIDFSTMTAAGACQTSQAMAIHYGLFKKAERPAAFTRLLQLIHQAGNHINAGALGLRVLFHVLSDHGHADLAYQMITTKDYPSYANWITRGATSLWEDFLPPEAQPHSQNHHFFGDISSWFIRAITGINPNPHLDDPDYILLAPNFIQPLTQAQAAYQAPSGKLTIEWHRTPPTHPQNPHPSAPPDTIQLNIQSPPQLKGTIRLPQSWQFEDGFPQKPLLPGTYTCRYTP